MSVIEYDTANSDSLHLSAGESSAPRGFHRIREVRVQQGMSLRSVARRMHKEPRMLRHEEESSTDLNLSTLYEWQRVLDVPVADLLEEADSPISRPVLERARMVRLMKTAAALKEKANNESLRRLTEMLVDQLVEIMPELKDVSAWHNIGQRRTMEEYGRTLERRIPDDFFRD